MQFKIATTIAIGNHVGHARPTQKTNEIKTECPAKPDIAESRARDREAQEPAKSCNEALSAAKTCAMP
ncbi:hypothetical protein [Bradyrhizobium sp.]|jgi:hypothetical protein|uniref:hypothetical protein n=1 Tax=Bradyrhizobium sp. TaxID=376 RepID=UPI002DDCF214|nr:hypothetical protein [Bradyrhizobium sp.]HEV2154710.1 hypothetical protein [Bradyrhizobium sp.]